MGALWVAWIFLGLEKVSLISYLWRGLCFREIPDVPRAYFCAWLSFVFLLPRGLSACRFVVSAVPLRLVLGLVRRTCGAMRNAPLPGHGATRAGRARGKEKKVGGTCARRAQRAREARERPSGRKKKSQGTFYLMSLPGAFPLVLRRFVGDHFSDSRGN